MPQLYNYATKMAENIPDENVGHALLTGTHDVPQGGRINLVDKYGEMVGIDAPDVVKAIKNEGYTFPTPDQAKEARLDAMYNGGAYNTAAAGAAGFARGATFGLSDAVAPALGITTKEALLERKKRNPLSSAAGEVGGFATLSALAPEIGAGAIAEGAGGAAADVVGQAVAKTGLESAGTLGSLAAKGLTNAAQGAIKVGAAGLEGAAFSAQDVLDDAILGDKNLTGEQVWTRIGMGAFLGTQLKGAEELMHLGKLDKILDLPEKLQPFLDSKVIPEKAESLIKLWRTSAQVSKEVVSKAKAVFSTAEKFAPYVAGVLPGAAEETPKEDQIQDYRDKTDFIRQLAANPQMLVDHMAERTNKLSEHAPNVTGAMQEASARAVGFLNSKIPKQPPDMPMSNEWVPSDKDMAEFSKYYNALKDPVAEIGKIKTGTISNQAVEAISNVLPSFYNQTKQDLLEVMANNMAKNNTVPYQTKISISRFLQQPIVRSANPEMILLNQASLMAPSKQNPQNIAAPRQKTTQTGLSKLNIAERSLTPMQKSNQRIE